MATRLDPRARLTFGPFELDVSKEELSRAGIRVRLSGQPMEILLVLLAHAGEVVSREQLRARVWSDGTFVDFEGGLNAAIAKLRRALEDSAQYPRYIETVPGRGYRFLGRVDSSIPENQAAPGTHEESNLASLPVQIPAGKRPGIWRLVEIGIVGVVLLGMIAWRVHDFMAFSPPAWRLSPLTTSAALEDWPTISPNGKLVVYSADPDFSGKVDLYLKDLASGTAPIRLTSDGEGNRMADFSPDGRRIVFRSNRNGGGIYQMPASGGEVQLVVKGGLNPKFSPDGRQIAYWIGSESVAAAVPESGSVWVVPLGGGQSHRIGEQLTSARRPIWLPDGKSVLVVGYSSAKLLDATSLDWWMASVDGERLTRTGLYDELVRRGLQPSDVSANSRLRTPVPGIVPPGCWSPKQDAVITTLQSGDNSNVWAVGISPKTGRVTEVLTRLTTGTANEWNASCTSVGTLAFTNRTSKRQLWALPFDLNQAASRGLPHPVVEDANDRENPTLSADGRYLAFVSNESGRPNIWRRDLRMGSETQVANSALVQRYPSISPSGRKIAYSAYDSNNRVLYVVDADHRPEKLCDGCTRATDWSRSEDSLLVFGESPYQIKLLSLATQKQTTLLSHNKYGLLYGRFSPDGRWISFTMRVRPDLAKIVVAPLNGAKLIPENEWIVIADVGIDDYANWSPDGKTLYFSSPKDGNSCLWAQHIHATTGMPIGEAFAVHHFHGRLTFGHGGWTTAGGHFQIALVDTTSNVWTMSQ